METTTNSTTIPLATAEAEARWKASVALDKHVRAFQYGAPHEPCSHCK